MASKTATVKHNTDAIAAMRSQQAVANVTGDTCPKCGGGVNPTILANFGHCLSCQRAAFFA